MNTVTIQYTVPLPNGKTIVCADKPSADRLAAFLNTLPAVPKPATKRAAPRKATATKGTK